MPAGKLRMYRKRRQLPRAPARGLNKVERKQTTRLAKQVVLRNQEVKQRAWQINSAYTLKHNKEALLFGTSTNGGLLELQQQGATTGTHLTSRPHPVTSTPLNNPGFLREGNKVKCSSVHLNLCCTTPNDRQGTKLRVIMFWFPQGHSTTWEDLVGSSGMTGSYNQLLVPTNRNSVCKIFMDKVYTLGVPGPGAAAGGNYQTTTMIKLRKSFKGGKAISYDSGATGSQPDKWNIGFACVAFNNNDAINTDTVANFEYSGNMYFRDA
jgi:hypothetical protein